MKPRLLQIIGAVLMGLNAHALDTEAVLDHADVRRLNGKKSIPVQTSGFIPVGYTDAARMLAAPDLYTTIQQAYARSVARDGTIEFPITETEPRHYCYRNEDEDETEIIELYRQQTEPGVFDIISVASGRRFFGRYEVLIHIRVVDIGAHGIAYTADVHAYPHNGPIRFLARHLGVVERYFYKNTRLMEWAARKVSLDMAGRTVFLPAAPPSNMKAPYENKSYRAIAEVPTERDHGKPYLSTPRATDG